MYQLDQKIKVCPACSGWGIDKTGKSCNQCRGKEVYIADGGKVFSFEIPMFIDYGLRRKTSLIRSSVLTTLVGLSLLTFITLIFILYQIFK